MGRWLLGIILLAIISLALAWFDFSPISAKTQGAKMKTSVENALASAGYDGIDVTMDRNIFRLSGEAASEETLQAAVKLAQGTHCEACKNSKPIWHVVESKMTVKKAPVVQAPAIPTQSPYTFSALKAEDGQVRLSGYVRNEAERNRLLREAATIFGSGNVTDDVLKIANGSPNNSWGDIVSKYFGQMNGLDRASLKIDNNQVVLTGLTSDEALRSRINGMADGSLGYNEAVNITVPDTAAAFTGTLDSAGVCQGLFDDIKGKSKIEFATNSADIGGRSISLLNSLAAAAKQCPTFDLSIVGHTDSVGNPDYNIDLSLRRAKSVVDYISSQDVSVSRLVGSGQGAASPIATNDTPQGRAANRRIEFTVTQSE